MSTVTALPSSGGDIRMVVASEIRAEMGRKGYKQADMAVALGVSQSQVSKRLRGVISLDVVELAAVAQWLDVPVAQLVGGAGRPHGPNPGDSGSGGTSDSISL